MYMESGTQHHVTHFHAYCQDDVGVFSLDPVELIAGSLPGGSVPSASIRERTYYRNSGFVYAMVAGVLLVIFGMGFVIKGTDLPVDMLGYFALAAGVILFILNWLGIDLIKERCEPQASPRA
jgi:hypothetical protein